MLAVKIAGALIVITASSFIGQIYSRRFINRHKELLHMQVALEILCSEIKYIKTPLPEAFRKIASRVEEPVASLFIAAAAQLEQYELTPNEIWQQVIEDGRKSTSFSGKDIFVIKQLGVVIEGNPDSDSQVRQVYVIESEINKLINEAGVEREKNVKVWRYLGLLGGFALAILFF